MALKKVLVLAGNYEQYRQWLRDNNHHSKVAVYGADAEQIFGIEVSKVVTTGTFWERNGASELYALAKLRERTESLAVG